MTIFAPFFALHRWDKSKKKREAMPPPQNVLLLHDFDGAEDFVHHFWDDGISVCLQCFCSPLAERNGKAVHIKGNPIISSVNRGDRREVCPAAPDFLTSSESLDPFASSYTKSPIPCCWLFGPRFLKSCVTGVGNIPLPAIADRLCPICEFGFHVFVHFTPSMAVSVGSKPCCARYASPIE